MGLVTNTSKSKSDSSKSSDDDDLTVTPTIGYNVKEFSYKGVVFNCWDLGGQKNIRSLWSKCVC